MEEQEEMETKYLIKNLQGTMQDDEYIFKQILQETRHLDHIQDYNISTFTLKKRNYRYFDTFDARLTDKEIFTYIGPLEQEGISMSARQREHDYVLTVKFPKGDTEEREEYEFPIPAGTDLYELNPDDFQYWGPLKRARQIGRNMPLQEIIRLEVETYRFDLESDRENKVQVALDDVTVVGPFNVRRQFYELEVERLKEGKDSDVQKVCAFFKEQYKPYLKRAPQAKWIKARELIRGGTIKIVEDEEEGE